MRRTQKLKRDAKRFYRKMQRHSLLISLTVSLLLLTIAQIGSHNALRLAESWRDAVIRSWGDEGAKPIKAGDTYGVNFNREPSATLSFSTSVHVEIIRGNSTLPELVNATSSP